ncbi:MAG TPA: helix-turn-helix domain-containing protein [Pyrinomonadaceae bacterium]
MIGPIETQATRPGEMSIRGLEKHLDQRVQQVISLMKENYQKPLRLDRLARLVNLSIWHLGHLFKSETGQPPAQYLKEIRLSQARHLLATEPLSIKEVMNKVGLRDQSHFAKDFKKRFGLTPTRYRASILFAQNESEAAAEAEELEEAGPKAARAAG